MALLFVSNIVPDRAPFNGQGFTRSGNNVLLGIAQALPESETPELLSCRPSTSFPHGPLWKKGETVKIQEDGPEIQILPTLNLKVLKNLFWGLQVKRYIRKWAARHKGERMDVLVYNIYTPPISWLYKACKRYGCKLTAILYDLGVPPARLGLSFLTMLGYQAMERQAKRYIPLLDGRVVINERIVRHYAPGKDFLLVDGGINDDVMSRLFPLEEPSSEEFVFVLAGMLWDQNGTKLVMDCLQGHPELSVKVVFAGNGIDVPKIQAFARQDSRVSYAGMLSPEELFKLYAKADVLLNLRKEEEEDFHFPSKLLEYLATGKHVISTPVAHAERDYGQFMTLLQEGTPETLAVAIKSVMQRGKASLYEQGKRARAYMIEKRRWAVRTQEILDYLHR